jgi:peptidoglycan-N-acetylglucosamine deacetylase
MMVSLQMGKALSGNRARQVAVFALGMLAAGTANGSASAADCPGNPGAIGTSRTLVVDPREHTRIGTMQYAETLPLQDHEVVLTFDDGPLPPHTEHVLETLASECVKATFFMVGRMANSYPAVVRRVYAEGHDWKPQPKPPLLICPHVHRPSGGGDPGRVCLYPSGPGRSQ